MRCILVVLVFLLLLPSTAGASLGIPALHPGSRGPDVAALQWLLSGHKPNVFTGIKPTLKRYTKGIYGARTKAALLAYKFRLGYPGIGQCTKVEPHVKWTSTEAGPFFFALLLGHKSRPECWVALAANRTKIVIESTPTPLALKLTGFERGQVGVSEPLAFYRYNAYFRLPALAWCAIFQNYSMVHVGLSKFGGANPWYVPAIIDWARAHKPSWLQARAKAGAFVTFYGSISHIGYVIGVDKKDHDNDKDPPGYTTIEGNWNNRVAIVHHTWGDHLRYFVWIPWLVH